MNSIHGPRFKIRKWKCPVCDKKKRAEIAPECKPCGVMMKPS